MMNKDQLRNLIQRVLKQMPSIPYSEDAVELLLMTAAHESKLVTYIKQVGGPALGIFQMEPATERDIWDNYLSYRKRMESHVARFLFQETCEDEVDELECNLAYQIAIARVHYWRSPDPLPKGHVDMSLYAKKVWNTEDGKAIAMDYYNAYKELC